MGWGQELAWAVSEPIDSFSRSEMIWPSGQVALDAGLQTSSTMSRHYILKRVSGQTSAGDEPLLHIDT